VQAHGYIDKHQTAESVRLTLLYVVVKYIYLKIFIQLRKHNISEVLQLINVKCKLYESLIMHTGLD